MGKMINTVTGLQDVDTLGVWSLHEHAYSEGHSGGKFEPMNDFDRSLTELLAYKSAGGNTITDCMPVGAHRDCVMLKKLSEASGVNIVASTGFHVSPNYEPDSPFLLNDEEMLYEAYYSELTEGMYPFNNYESELEAPRTDIKAGNVKTAYTDRDPEWFDCHLHAAARAARDTGSTICVHTGGQAAITAAEKLMNWGIEPGKILLCHTDSIVDDYEYHETMAKMGVYQEFDRLGDHAGRSDHECYDDKVADLVLHMFEKGYDKVTVSLDLTTHDLSTYYGSVPLDYALTTFKKIFFEHGGTEEQWYHMTVENPKNYFG